MVIAGQRIVVGLLYQPAQLSVSGSQIMNWTPSCRDTCTFTVLANIGETNATIVESTAYLELIRDRVGLLLTPNSTGRNDLNTLRQIFSPARNDLSFILTSTASFGMRIPKRVGYIPWDCISSGDLYMWTRLLAFADKPLSAAYSILEAVALSASTKKAASTNTPISRRSHLGHWRPRLRTPPPI